MRRVVKTVPHKRRYLALAILALAVAAAAALTTGSVSAPFASAATPDTCGYNGATTPAANVARAAQKFNEIGIIEGLTLSPNTGDPKTVNVFYSDEHALTLGTGAVQGWSAFYTKPASTVKNADDAGSNPNNVGGGPTHTPGALNTGTGGADPGGRPMAPSLFLTDRTGAANATSKAGDWQNQNGGAGGDDGNPTAQKPNYVGGTWKSAGAANPLGSDGKAATNGKPMNLGTHAETYTENISTSQGIEAYAAELRWDVATMDSDSGTAGVQPLKGGHTYRVQMIVHDGDHVADTGQACVDITLAKANSQTVTTPKVKVTEDVNVTVSTSASATATVKAGDTLTIKLFKATPTPASGTGCDNSGTATDNHNGGTGATQQGNTITHVIQQSEIDPNTGEINIGTLTYPDDFQPPPAPALTSGKYWWSVVYGGNDEVNGSDDGCTETFNLNL